MKLCKDCKHYSVEKFLEDRHLCRKFVTENIDPVTGMQYLVGFKDAYDMRQTHCGMDAVYYEAK